MNGTATTSPRLARSGVVTLARYPNGPAGPIWTGSAQSLLNAPLSSLLIQLDSSAVADATEIADLTKVVLGIAAVFVVATWALYKAGKGRVFGRKLNPSITATIVSPRGEPMVKLSAKVHNVGQTKIHFDPDGMAFRLYVDDGPAPVTAHATEPEWEWVGTVSAFAEHDSIEPQESLSEDKLFSLPVGSHHFVKSEVSVVSKKAFLSRQLAWSCTVISELETKQNNG